MPNTPASDNNSQEIQNSSFLAQSMQSIKKWISKHSDAITFAIFTLVTLLAGLLAIGSAILSAPLLMTIMISVSNGILLLAAFVCIGFALNDWDTRDGGHPLLMSLGLLMTSGVIMALCVAPPIAIGLLSVMTMGLALVLSVFTGSLILENKENSKGSPGSDNTSPKRVPSTTILLEIDHLKKLLDTHSQMRENPAPFQSRPLFSPSARPVETEAPVINDASDVLTCTHQPIDCSPH